MSAGSEVPSPEDESKFKILHSFNFVFVGRVSLKSTLLNQYSDSLLSASIISRFEGGLFGETTLSTKYLVSHCNSFFNYNFLSLNVHKPECVFRLP